MYIDCAGTIVLEKAKIVVFFLFKSKVPHYLDSTKKNSRLLMTGLLMLPFYFLTLTVLLIFFFILGD